MDTCACVNTRTSTTQRRTPASRLAAPAPHARAHKSLTDNLVVLIIVDIFILYILNGTDNQFWLTYMMSQFTSDEATDTVSKVKDLLNLKLTVLLWDITNTLQYLVHISDVPLNDSS